MDVGFIGIGSMGAAMVPNLVKAGHQVQAWNRNPAAAKALEGVTAVASPAAAFANEAVVTMLSDDTAVRSVIIDGGALAAARKGCVHVMMATISLALVEELQELHRAAEVSYVAAPVFGVPAVAAQAQLNIMAAGDARAVAAIKPLLDAMGQKTWRLGDDPRQANVAKIAGNCFVAEDWPERGAVPQMQLLRLRAAQLPSHPPGAARPLRRSLRGDFWTTPRLACWQTPQSTASMPPST